jgi:hypothetical protein
MCPDRQPGHHALTTPGSPAPLVHQPTFRLARDDRSADDGYGEPNRDFGRAPSSSSRRVVAVTRPPALDLGDQSSPGTGVGVLTDQRVVRTEEAATA